jgi:hypothetical protein
VPGTLGGHKTISVPGGYDTKTMGKPVARFLATGLLTEGPAQFPATAVDASTLAAALWFPAATYTGITAGDYGGTVTSALVPYTSGGGEPAAGVVLRQAQQPAFGA